MNTNICGFPSLNHTTKCNAQQNA